MEDVAREAGLGVAVIYNHFPSKDALVTTAYAPLMQPLFNHAEEDLAQGVVFDEAPTKLAAQLQRGDVRKGRLVEVTGQLAGSRPVPHDLFEDAR